MVVHPDLAARMVDVDVGRRDVRVEIVLLDCARRLPARSLADVRGVGAHRREVRRLQCERSGRVHAPRTGERVGAGEPDVRTLVVGEVQVVAAERLLDPVGNPDERGAVDVGPHPVVHVGPDDRLGAESYGTHRTHFPTSFGFRSRCPCPRARATRRAHARPRSAPPADPSGTAPSDRWRYRRACT